MLDLTRPEPEVLSSLARSIAAEFDLALERPERVAELCERLREELPRAEPAARRETLLGLARLLPKRGAALAGPLVAVLEEAIGEFEEPATLLAPMLEARDPELARRALALALRRVDYAARKVDPALARLLAARVESEGGPFEEPGALAKIGRLLGPSEDALRSVLLEPGPMEVRRLAARVLDVDGSQPPGRVAEALLGPPAQRFLAPYLSYTRAGCLDLLQLGGDGGLPAPVLDSLRRAEEACGEALLREVLAEIGWERASLGIEVRRVLGISLGGSMPYAVGAEEAPLLESLPEARRASDSLVFVAHGTLWASPSGGRGPEDGVTRFRSYNLTHAAILADLLDLAPLTREKVTRVVARMDRIVEDFTAVFANLTEEIPVLDDVYRHLRSRVVAELERDPSAPQLSPELTRLVQAFEDPRSLGEVRTLHGLKRYLHQRGLRLGFRLVEAGRSTNRCVDLVLAAGGRVVQRLATIGYVDFETPAQATATERTRLPYPVAVVADGFARQLLHGHRSFPSVRIFCYGNEVHYYVAYGNHPAFLRIDYSPPLQGGMIDLEYLGVSNYELSVHPDPRLHAIRAFFRRLEFDCQVENTRIHARYDKERALDLGDLCAKAEALFCLVPYLMEVDWNVGSLDLRPEAREQVARAWAERFALWGAIPLGRILTADRRGILVGHEDTPTGTREIVWSGSGAYHDCFAPPPDAGALAGIASQLRALGIDAEPRAAEGASAVGQFRLERELLRPLREALRVGRVVASSQGLAPAPPGRFRRVHAAERFAEILASSPSEIVAPARVATLVEALERSLRFRTVGCVHGHEVQLAPLPLRGDMRWIFVLRDPSGIIRLAFASAHETLWQTREDPAAPWIACDSTDAASLSQLLRGNGYFLPGPLPTLEDPLEEVERILQMFQRSGVGGLQRPVPGEKLLPGLRASPGRAVGPVLFGTAGRQPKDLDRAVLVASSVRPEDNTFLFHAAAIVSTGGGVLSHAGLIATQFQKPALVVPGVWVREGGKPASLRYVTEEFRQEDREVHGLPVSIRHGIRRREHELREGDLVVVDADAGTLVALGQEPDALVLHEGLALLGDLSERLDRASGPEEILALRGRRVRARYQVEKLLSRLSDPVLARHAVEEIVRSKAAAGSARDDSGGASLLGFLLENPVLGAWARGIVVDAVRGLAERLCASLQIARGGIPTSGSLHEILSLRLDVLRLHHTLRGARAASGTLVEEAAGRDVPPVEELDVSVRARLQEIRADCRDRIERLSRTEPPPPRLRHHLRLLERLDAVLGRSDDGLRTGTAASLAAWDDSAVRACSGRSILWPEDGGFELHPLIGWKAANLSEVSRLGEGGLVPGWFVVAGAAFARVLDAPLSPGPALRHAIEAVLGNPDLGCAQKAARIRALWSRVRLPDDLAREVLRAYARLAGEAPDAGDGSAAFVAIRSSALEEDAELAARAGEFETFLFVRGEQALLEHLKAAWSGLWTERAIHNREVMGAVPGSTGGGVIVQRIVRSRVSGVVQTVNVAEGNPREIVINAGLGLGEGIVSGVVAADHVVVAKEGNLERGPLRFRYIVSDKAERVTFDERKGLGTIRVESLYHQRLRPALEYVELLELVAVATRLEGAYGYPLDIEFGIEGTRLFILQARPVGAHLAALRETLERRPLAASAPPSTPCSVKEATA